MAVAGSAKHQRPVDGLTVLATDFRSDRVLAELPATNLRFGSKAKTPDSFSFDLVLGDTKLKKIDAVDCTNPVQRAVFIDYKGKLVYGGLVWARSYAAATSVLSISGQEFGSFYTSQIVPVSLTFAQVDQFDIVRRFIAEIDKLDGGNINLAIDLEGVSHQLRDRKYYWYNRKDVLTNLKELSEVINGFEYAFDVRYGSDGRPEKVLTLSYPRLGLIGAGGNRLFDYPGNLTDYSYPEDGTAFATDMMALGVGEGPGMKVGRAVNTQVKLAGFPRLDATQSYKTVSQQPTLDGHAQQDLERADHLFISGTFTTQVDVDPQFGSYNIGDDARFRLTSGRHPSLADGRPGVDMLYRISAWTVDGSSGQVVITAGDATLPLP